MKYKFLVLFDSFRSNDLEEQEFEIEAFDEREAWSYICSEVSGGPAEVVSVKMINGSETDRLRAALEKYADEKNWHEQYDDRGGSDGVFDFDFDNITEFPWLIAQEALKND